MKSFLHCIAVLCAIVPVLCLALVNPETTAMPTPPWSAEIFVVSEDGSYEPYCRGSLIASQWVLSSSSCYFDPYKAKDTAADATEPAFAVRLGNAETYHAVAETVESDDFYLTLLRLESAVTHTPLKLSTQTAATLLGSGIIIFGNHSTLPVSHSYFNPAPGPGLSCTIDEQTFFTSDTLCYLLGTKTSSATILSTTGTVVDPAAAGAPATALDKAVEIDASGARLYVDFSAKNSYPCNEDLGAPVLWRNGSGELEQVGVVSQAGMAAGLPICTRTLANDIRSVAHYQAFITETLVDYQFARLCPEAPKPVLAYTGGNGINISWPAIAGATGYRIHYTNRIGQTPIALADLKGQTQLSVVSLNPDYVYSATVTAYNNTCTGAQSEVLTIRF